MKLCSEEAGVLESLGRLSPGVLERPHPVTQHMVPADGMTGVLGRQTGWTRGDQDTGSLSSRRAMSLVMRLSKSS